MSSVATKRFGAEVDEATRAIRAVVRRVERDEQASRLIGEPNSTGEAKQALAEIISWARESLRNIDRLSNHVCAWNEDDRCNTCGADGRA